MTGPRVVPVEVVNFVDLSITFSQGPATMTHFLKQLFAGEEGATMVEYALMVALIGAALAGVVGTLGGAISGKFSSVQGTISSGTASGGGS